MANNHHPDFENSKPFGITSAVAFLRNQAS
jgi:hypothetical protein